MATLCKAAVTDGNSVFAARQIAIGEAAGCKVRGEIKASDSDLPDTQSHFYAYNIIFANLLIGKCRSLTGMPQVINLKESGGILLKEKITKTYNINDLEQGF
jgi:Zn-dependent alcohol dehydrogenase